MDDFAVVGKSNEHKSKDRSGPQVLEKQVKEIGCENGT